MPTTPPTSEPPARAWAAWWVWGVWAVLLAGNLVYVAVHGANVPHGDDWDLVLSFTRDQPLTVDWMWCLHGEHRLLFPKVILFTLFQLTWDFRAGMYFNVLGLAALAAGLVLAVRRLRGRLEFPDAFLPLMLLNPAHYWTTLWNVQAVFVLPALLAGVVFLILVRHGLRLTPVAALISGLCLALLPVCGAPGLTYVPALLAWLVVAALASWRGRGAAPALIGLVLAVGTVGVVAVYLRDNPLLGMAREGTSDLTASLTGAAEFLATSLGPLAVDPFHEEDRVWPVAVSAMLVNVGLTLAVLAWGWAVRPGERGRLFALLLFGGVFAALALALGRGRGSSQLPVAFKYVTVLVPVWYWFYFVWLLAAPPAAGRVARWALLALGLVSLVPNTAEALRHGRQRQERAEAFLNDLLDGVPPYRLVLRHSIHLYPYVHDKQACPADFKEWLPALRRQAVGDFVHLADDPPFDVVAVPLKPTHVQDVTWDDGTMRVTGEAPLIEFAVPAGRPVAGLRVEYTDTALHDGARVGVTVQWKGPRDADYTDANLFYHEPLVPELDVQIIFFWIDERVRHVRLGLDANSGEMRIRQIVVLVPRAAGRGPPRSPY